MEASEQRARKAGRLRMRVRSEDLGGPAASDTAVHMEVVSCSYGSSKLSVQAATLDLSQPAIHPVLHPRCGDGERGCAVEG